MKGFAQIFAALASVAAVAPVAPAAPTTSTVSKALTTLMSTTCGVSTNTLEICPPPDDVVKTCIGLKTPPGVCVTLPEYIRAGAVGLAGQDAPMTCFVFKREAGGCGDSTGSFPIKLDNYATEMTNDWWRETGYYRCDNV